MTQVRYLVIHHTAGPVTQTPDDIARYHVKKLGWGGVGYHFIIARDGKVYYVGDLTTARAHVFNYNHLAIGICLIGNFDTRVVPTVNQLDSAHELCSQLLFRTPQLPGVDGWEDVVPHKGLGATACPGRSWDTWRMKIVTGVRGVATKNKRAKEITRLYQVILGRDPDQLGLTQYLESSLTVEEIRKEITESGEHRQIITKAKSYNKLRGLSSEAKDFVSKAYQKLDEVDKLGS